LLCIAGDFTRYDELELCSQQKYHLFEDGVEQTIKSFSGEDAPLSIGMAFDTSGSMGEKLRNSR
jgi:hypothetical protein